jgi:hypothetical protein
MPEDLERCLQDESSCQFDFYVAIRYLSKNPDAKIHSLVEDQLLKNSSWSYWNIEDYLQKFPNTLDFQTRYNQANCNIDNIRSYFDLWMSFQRMDDTLNLPLQKLFLTCMKNFPFDIELTDYRIKYTKDHFLKSLDTLLLNKKSALKNTLPLYEILVPYSIKALKITVENNPEKENSLKETFSKRILNLNMHDFLKKVCEYVEIFSEEGIFQNRLDEIEETLTSSTYSSTSSTITMDFLKIRPHVFAIKEAARQPILTGCDYYSFKSYIKLYPDEAEVLTKEFRKHLIQNESTHNILAYIEEYGNHDEELAKAAFKGLHQHYYSVGIYLRIFPEQKQLVIEDLKSFAIKNSIPSIFSYLRTYIDDENKDDFDKLRAEVVLKTTDVYALSGYLKSPDSSYLLSEIQEHASQVLLLQDNFYRWKQFEELLPNFAELKINLQKRLKKEKDFSLILDYLRAFPEDVFLQQEAKKIALRSQDDYFIQRYSF